MTCERAETSRLTTCTAKKRDVGEMTMGGRQVRFDPTLNLGHVLTIIALIGSVLLAYENIVREVDNHETRLKAVERQINQTEQFQRQVLTNLTTIREDIATLKERSRDSPPPHR